MHPKINIIKEKLDALRKADSNCQVFGAQKHRYILFPVLTEAEIQAFEQKHSIKFPEEYRDFLKYIGNGGAGPYYGMEKMEDGLYADLDYKSEDELVDLSKPFPLTAYWNFDFENMTEEEYNQSSDDYNDPKHANGLLRVANYGCGISINLVVNGEDYGKMWMDDRCNENGFYPEHYFGNQEKVGFLDWYELWLDSELKQYDKKGSDRRTR